MYNATMVEALSMQLKKVSFNEPSKDVDSLIEAFAKIEVEKKQPFILSILNKMKQMPQTPAHVRKNLQKDHKILQARIKREHRKLAKLVSKSESIQHNKVEISENENTENKENNEEEYTEVYEESFLEETEDQFDIDNFNDE